MTSFVRGVAYALLLVAIANVGRAQVLYGSLTGNVTDPSAASVAGAKVEALNTATGVARQADTDEHGAYTIANLQAGAYTVTISAPSLATVVQNNVQVEANAVRRVDVQLQLTQVSQQVEVDAPVVALKTDRADVSTEISASQVTELPLGKDRNFQSLFRIVPGSSTPITAHSKAGNPTGSLAQNVNGQSDTANMTRIDGTIDPNFWELDVIAYVPPAEAIEAVNVVTGSYDAERGMAGGAAVNVTIKSGTNELHGAAWEYNTKSALNARNFFYNAPNNPKNILNQFGLRAGGPIVKNKLFFFADWERYLLRQNLSGFQTVATDALRQGNFAGTGTTVYDPSTGNPDGSGRQPFPNNQIPASLFSSAAVKMAALVPTPNQPGGIANDYFASGGLQFTRDSADLKINYNHKSTLFTRYSAAPTSIFEPQALGPAGGATLDGGNPGNAPGLTQSAAVGWTYTFTSHLLLDANIGYTRQRLAAENTDLDKNYGLDVLGIPGTNGPNRLQGGYPNFTISGFSALGNPVLWSPFVFLDNEYLGAANLSWNKGSHSFRFGMDINRFQINHFQAQLAYGARGGFSFTGGLTALKGGAAPNLYNSRADFMLGLPQSMGKDNQYIDPATVRESTYAFYARDQWQVSRKLTVSYGVRWEYFPFATRDHFGGDAYNPANNTVYLGGVNGVPENAGINVGSGQFSPRLGIAYRLNDHTVIRTGYGISTDPYFFTYMRDAYPAVISQQFPGATSYMAGGSLATGIPALVSPSLGQGTYQLPTNVGTSTYPQNFDRGYIQSYNFTVQRSFGEDFNIQAGYVGTHAVRAVAQLNLNADARVAVRQERLSTNCGAMPIPSRKWDRLTADPIMRSSSRRRAS